MTEIFIPFPSKDVLDLYLEQNFDGFLVGIEKYSENFNNYIKISDLDKIIKKVKKHNKKLYICFNRLYFNDEIEDIKETIKEIIKHDVTGIGYSDIGVLNILSELNYDKEIIWLSNHLGTNSKTINFLGKRNVRSVLLSSELCLDEIISIKKNTNIRIGTILYGFLNMATSSRKLLTNYFEYIDKKKEKNNYYIKDKVKEGTYSLIEEKNTNFFTNSVLNGLKYFPELIKNKIDFIILDDYMLDSSNFYNVIEAFSSLRNAYDDEKFVDSLNEVVIYNTYYDTFDGFLNKKTVYKVKDYE